MTNPQSTNSVTMITISQASQMLGVSEPTLRQWTDEGKVKAFVTPGGHRRYAEAELRRFLGVGNKVQGIRDLVAKMELAPEQEIRIAHTHFASFEWYKNLDEQGRARFADFGRRMYNLVVSYVSKPKKRQETLLMARALGREFGGYLVEADLSLTDSLEAFLLHRSPLVNAATDLMKARQSLNERAVEAVPLVTQITDEALVALVEAYQQGGRQ